VVEQIFFLLDEFLRSEVAVFIKKVDFEDLLAVRSVRISKDICNQKRKHVTEGSVSNICRESVVVIGVEELNQW
jgi:hypothetical protein